MLRLWPVVTLRPAMHIPDGFLDAKTLIASAGLAAAGVGLALRQARRTLPPRRVPLMGLAAAFVFAAQLVNFPVAFGTSGHLLGGVLAAILLGPSGAVVVMTAVLLTQALLFTDGGVLALGANLLNMALLGPLGGYGLYRLVRRMAGPSRRAQIMAAAFAAWASVGLAAAGCAGQLAWSGTFSWGLGFPAMVNVHLVIGLGEGLLTALILSAIARVRPELLAGDLAGAGTGRVAGVGLGLVVALALALFVAPFASPWPDGLDRIAAVFGFEAKAVTLWPAPLANYQWPGLTHAVWATAWATGIGTVVAFGLAWFLARWLVPTKPHNS